MQRMKDCITTVPLHWTTQPLNSNINISTVYSCKTNQLLQEHTHSAVGQPSDVLASIPEYTS